MIRSDACFFRADGPAPKTAGHTRIRLNKALRRRAKRGVRQHLRLTPGAAHAPGRVQAMRREFLWRRSPSCPRGLPLYLLKEGDNRAQARPFPAARTSRGMAPSASE